MSLRGVQHKGHVEREVEDGGELKHNNETRYTQNGIGVKEEKKLEIWYTYIQDIFMTEHVDISSKHTSREFSSWTRDTFGQSDALHSWPW